MHGTEEVTARDLLARIFEADQDLLIDDWVRLQLADSPAQLGEEGLRREAKELLGALHGALGTDLPPGQVVERDEAVRSALRGLSERRARAGAAPSATAQAIFALKRTALTALERHTDDPAARYSTSQAINQLLDAAGLLTFSVYVEGREEIIRRQHQQMVELSTPVVRLWRQVLAVPLIGTLDSARTQVVMQNLLEAIQTHQARVAIIDITGVSTVDTAVAQHLLQTVSAVRLMGAECLISGVRPSIAQTITQLGIDLSHIVTRGSLADALATAMTLLDGPRTHAVTG
ncbi:STAS domain-containing protein [Amycolatopsis regifaucium]|uniref:Anti-anti-sigma factor n=1 Tax=Amycolatopsis regifaucium TaxID=546365 RepID=A0A154MMG6_9PSEU|nr:STAS domain-containing protein [Amycolatopsis regifaucium]KZB85502.1 anti-anti-sigma factor [Amycolatopsis regifaucium]OKA09054.1 anti-anti-sigma factor [Amycolatopsis regifaucium]